MLMSPQPRSATRRRPVLALLALGLAVPLAAGPPQGFDGHEGPPGRGGELGTDTPPAGPGRPGPTVLPEPGVVELRAPLHRGVARGHVVVRFRAGVPRTERERIALQAGGHSYQRARWGDFGRVQVAPESSPEDLLETLRSDPAVAWAQLDPIYSGAVDSVNSVPAPAHLNDPLFSSQWPLEHIRYHEMLGRNSTGARGVVVAVVDSGVAFGSGGSFPAARGVDLEGVSFLPGRDFVDNGPPFDRGIRIRNEPLSRARRFGHGTFAAALIAAQVNNGVAMAGIAPEVTILPVRVLHLNNSVAASILAEAVRFAVAAGADVINMSIGGPEPFEPLRDALDAAHRAGVVVVASAGNEAGTPNPPADVLFPSRYPTVVAVGATAFDGTRATYSSTGPSLDLMAPAGENALSILGDTRDAALSTSFIHDPVTGETAYGGFFANGTSFAAPQVTAAAALLVALGVDDPDAVRFILEESVRDLGAPGRDAETGHGLLDLLRAHLGAGFTS